MRWVLSEQPSDWITGTSLVVSIVSLIVTTLYVTFTYRLLRTAILQANAASDAARAALQQARYERYLRVAPVLAAGTDALRLSRELQAYLADIGAQKTTLVEEKAADLVRIVRRGLEFAITVSLDAHEKFTSALQVALEYQKYANLAAQAQRRRLEGFFKPADMNESIQKQGAALGADFSLILQPLIGDLLIGVGSESPTI